MKERETSIHWLTSQMSVTTIRTSPGQPRRLELNLGLPCGWQYLGCHLLSPREHINQKPDQKQRIQDSNQELRSGMHLQPFLHGWLNHPRLRTSLMLVTPSWPVTQGTDLGSLHCHRQRTPLAALHAKTSRTSLPLGFAHCALSLLQMLLHALLATAPWSSPGPVCRQQRQAGLMAGHRLLSEP